VIFGPSAVDAMFPDTATIQASTKTRDTEGSVSDDWLDVATDVPAQLSAPDTDTELRTGDGSFDVRTKKLILYGWHPEANEGARVLVGDQVFDVRGVVADSWGQAAGDAGWTVLIVEERPEEQLEEES
jgi:head-tail adaptor